MKRKLVAILGSTGSIGRSALKIVEKDKNFKVYLISANLNFNEICNQIKHFNPEKIVIKNYDIFVRVKKKFKKYSNKIYNNYDSITNIKKKIDYTISAIPGISGLEPTLDFVKISKNVLLANKESIVCGWSLINNLSKKFKCNLIPIDSEHFSINQLLKKYSINEIEKIYITASGGPFLKLPLNQFKKIKLKQAIRHPKWNMGKKISIDSATLANKVLEISEALKIFPFKINFYKIIIHPEALIHAVIKLKNGFSILLYHLPDMKIPIANALQSKYLFSSSYKILQKNSPDIQNLSFYEVENNRYPIVNLIHRINYSNSSLIVFNAANEIFVDQFLKKNIDFIDISRYLKLVINSKKYIKLSNMKCDNLEQILKIDHLARNMSIEIIKKKND